MQRDQEREGIVTDAAQVEKSGLSRFLKVQQQRSSESDVVWPGLDGFLAQM
jgi:hypothetical protein